MRQSIDPDASTAERAIRLFHKLLFDGRRHFQSDLAIYLGCSPQTVMRLIAEIEGVIGASLVTGLEKHRRWYQIRSVAPNPVGLDYEELRYMAVCRDLAAPYLPEQVKRRVDNSIFHFSMLMADREFEDGERNQKERISYCGKGWIDYTPFFGFLEKLVTAMEKKLVCIVSYQALGKNHTKEHRLAIKKIVNMNQSLYALGATVADNLKDRGILINLAIHRMKDVTLTDKKWCFHIPEENLDMFGLPWHKPKLFRIKFRTIRASHYVKERVWSENQKFLEQPDGTLILEMESRSEPEVVAWVRSFGEDAEILPILLSEDKEEI